MPRTRVVWFLPIATAMTLAVAPAQSGWVDRQLSTAPPGRSAALLAWIPMMQRIWWVGPAATGTEVWDYDGTTWSQLPSNGPVPSRVGPAAYDESRQRVVAMEGDDVWEFDGTTWTKIVPVAKPTPARTGFDLVYDGARQEVLMGGGEYFDTSGGPYAWYVRAGDLWAWTGTTWVQRYNGGGGGREGSVMVYDSDRQVVVSYGGAYSVPYYWTGQQTYYVVGDVWEWDGTSMTGGTRGAKRTNHAMAYDKLRRRVVAFGGFATCGYACGYQPATTDELTASGWTYRSPAPTPSPRNGAEMAFDERRQRIVLVGGENAAFQPTWEFFTPTPAQFSTFGAGCPGSVGTPAISLDAGRLPWLGETFGVRVDGVPTGSSVFLAVGASNTSFGGVTLPAPIAQAPGCSLLVSPDVAVAGTASGGRAATWSLAVPNLASLQGLPVYVQAAATDAAANALGLVFSDGGAATLEAL